MTNEAKIFHDEYFVDRVAWIRHKAVGKAREKEADAADRQEESLNVKLVFLDNVLEETEQHGADRPLLEENEAERAHTFRTMIEKIPADFGVEEDSLIAITGEHIRQHIKMQYLLR
ncbi:hypothetical protein SPOG_01614 [Schizosaccharomyces cryophilus OY26]|uniref:Uncharacterized protein n=1 Tax=Schizosaccharomyces cryophilus (strain OY26 / ATCC MYA-4695 / CBS 11777 / NBRC 106824 / NRRL Y48691) TaxID=653667 RepID=S9W179_SCHCR|nr:uncharacterized protein SPOG_01614 [Schizosaccharomyces cryophilus OY26]EPY52279.1 hypothetical protein SPOG_01614 [Schizosaccharomyces cryophilus OY26]